MNGRTSKCLRRKAESLSIGKEICTYTQNQRTEQIRVHPSCTRGKLKQLKKAEK